MPGLTLDDSSPAACWSGPSRRSAGTGPVRQRRPSFDRCRTRCAGTVARQDWGYRLTILAVGFERTLSGTFPDRLFRQVVQRLTSRKRSSPIVATSTPWCIAKRTSERCRTRIGESSRRYRSTPAGFFSINASCPASSSCGTPRAPSSTADPIPVVQRWGSPSSIGSGQSTRHSSIEAIEGPNDSADRSRILTWPVIGSGTP